jgi:hypothetical protein
VYGWLENKEPIVVLVWLFNHSVPFIDSSVARHIAQELGSILRGLLVFVSRRQGQAENILLGLFFF